MHSARHLVDHSVSSLCLPNPTCKTFCHDTVDFDFRQNLYESRPINKLQNDIILLIFKISTLTTYEDLQLAEIYIVVFRILDNDVTVSRHVAGTLEGDRCVQWNGARVLATHVVIPQRGWCDGR